jgi:hypothetical protein
MPPQGVSSEALATEEPSSAPTDPSQPQPPVASTDAVKRPRGRPRKVKAPIDATEPSPIPSVSVVADNPVSPSTQPQADAAPAKIQKSELTISEPRRHRDKAHLKFVASQPCLVCGRSPADAHHLRFTQARAMGTQGERRVHRAAVQKPSPRQPQLRRRSRLVGTTGHRSHRHIANALGLDPAYRMKARA